MSIIFDFDALFEATRPKEEPQIKDILPKKLKPAIGCLMCGGTTVIFNHTKGKHEVCPVCNPVTWPL